jgi:hypothetical protein
VRINRCPDQKVSELLESLIDEDDSFLIELNKEQLAHKLQRYQSFNKEAAWKKLNKKLKKKSGK